MVDQRDQLLASLSEAELAELIDNLGGGASTPAISGPVIDDDGFAELQEFLDDELKLAYKGKHYTLQAADIDLGLECQMLMGMGAKVRAGGAVSYRQKQQLNDAEEADLFVRLLGGQRVIDLDPWKQTCPVCDRPPGRTCEGSQIDQMINYDPDGDEDAVATAEPEPEPEDGAESERDADGMHLARCQRPNPRYSPQHDVWNQLRDEGARWTFVQHVGTTAMIWAAMGPTSALEFWRSGGLPKEVPAAAAPRQPQDRKGTATSTPKRDSGSSTTQKKRPRGKGSAGPTS